MTPKGRDSPRQPLATVSLRFAASQRQSAPKLGTSASKACYMHPFSDNSSEPTNSKNVRPHMRFHLFTILGAFLGVLATGPKVLAQG